MVEKKRDGMMIHLKLIKIIALSMCTNRTTAQKFLYILVELQQKNHSTKISTSLSFSLLPVF